MFRRRQLQISWAESSLLVQEDQSKQRQENLKRNHSTSSFLNFNISSTTKNKPSLSSALISKYIELTRAGQCRNPRTFAQIKSPGEKDMEDVKEHISQNTCSSSSIFQIQAHWYCLISYREGLGTSL